jgi:hypothetical protein
MDEQLTPAAFMPHLNKVFRVEGGHHELTLSKVDVRRLEVEEAKFVPRQPFTLIFSSPPRDLLREGLYTLAAEDGSRFELYVIPVLTPVATRQDYQVAIN